MSPRGVGAFGAGGAGVEAARLWLTVVWMVKIKAVLVSSEAFHVSGGAGQGEGSSVNFTGDDGVEMMKVLVAVIEVGGERAKEVHLLKGVGKESR